MKTNNICFYVGKLGASHVIFGPTINIRDAVRDQISCFMKWQLFTLPRVQTKGAPNQAWPNQLLLTQPTKAFPFLHILPRACQETNKRLAAAVRRDRESVCKAVESCIVRHYYFQRRDGSRDALWNPKITPQVEFRSIWSRFTMILYYSEQM
jgi:hypothetical protein